MTWADRKSHGNTALPPVTVKSARPPPAGAAARRRHVTREREPQERSSSAHWCGEIMVKILVKCR